MGESSKDFKVGDRVSTPSGIVGTIVKPPAYYERDKGDSFTGWGVVVEEDTDPSSTLTRIERGLSAGSWHLVNLDVLAPANE
jgi:hypothetical protein